jgi:ABC-2 type transport system permease protein
VRREVSAAFSSPTASVFITLFVFLSGVAAFWGEAFFARNMATLEELSGWFPALLLFLVPAITMGAWAEERKQGTDELLLTLPASEWQLALGKYLGCLVVYAVCLLFSTSHILVLAYLGSPDVGLLLVNYLGYLLAGAALCGVGLLASSISASATVAFIAAALSCGALVGLGLSEGVLSGPLAPVAALARELSVPARLEGFGRGVAGAGDIVYFVVIAAAGVAMTALVLKRRRSVGLAGAGYGVQGLARLVSVLVLGACAVVLVDRAGARIDGTSERLWTLSPQTRQIARGGEGELPVRLTAFVSREVPGALAAQKAQLLGTLGELEAASGGRVRTSVVTVEPGTPVARDAERAFGVRPREVAADGVGGPAQEVYLAAVAEGAGGEFGVVPFFARGLAVEYELARAVRSVGGGSRRTIGILETPVGVFGSFDFQTMQSRPDWPLVAELRKQYDVQRVNAGAEIPAEIDVLVVAQPSSLRQAELDRVTAWVSAGRATLILEDALPLINPQLATAEAQRPQGNPMMGQRDTEPKAKLDGLWAALGARVSGEQIVWDSYNPRPSLEGSPGEVLWLRARRAGGAGAGAGAAGVLFDPFAQGSEITSGLQEVVLLFAGRVERLVPVAGEQGSAVGTDFEALIKSGPTSGLVPYAQMISRNFLGMPTLNEARRPAARGTQQTLAARVTGGPSKVNAVLIGDVDGFSPQLFAIRESGNAELEFDNVPLILSAIDALAGDTGLLELRKKRRVHRTLERIDQRRQAELEDTLKIEEAARADAEARVSEARGRLEAKVKEVEERSDLDQNTRAIMLDSVRRAEQGRVDAQSAAIEAERRRRVEDARVESRQNIERIEGSVRALAVVLPPVPALLGGLVVTVGRRRRAEAARASS